MAKRRNQKKEKALRNLAYARKFRKRASSNRFGRRRYGSDNNAQDNDEVNQSDSNDSGAEAT